MEFRPRDYVAEDESHALPRLHADDHPLFSPPPLSDHHQVEDVVDCENSDFFDPLRAPDVNAVVPFEDIEDGERRECCDFIDSDILIFPFLRKLDMSDVIIKTGTGHLKSSTSMHLEELDDPQKFADEGVKVITGKEYVSRLHELKDEINRSWHAEDRATSLKLSIKVARLLMDTSVLQFYPTLFILATEVMDILGDMVWERIKQKAEFAEDGTRFCSLPENFKESSICFDAKETCNNWFHKVGTIRELLPRM
ncbi:hypothetical protein Pint_04080 [Pistacia integerrima]|uniref:Uncharacterized protein n=1 Tax=Pistacia integerrima TaxID=434235 RepID=A0ACC0Z4A8_9ROSI|nr:hypothetical protein Pint_04080 [Pistacia integerrima]